MRISPIVGLPIRHRRIASSITTCNTGSTSPISTHELRSVFCAHKSAALKIATSETSLRRSTRRNIQPARHPLGMRFCRLPVCTLQCVSGGGTVRVPGGAFRRFLVFIRIGRSRFHTWRSHARPLLQVSILQDRLPDLGVLRSYARRWHELVFELLVERRKTAGDGSSTQLRLQRRCEAGETHRHDEAGDREARPERLMRFPKMAALTFQLGGNATAGVRTV